MNKAFRQAMSEKALRQLAIEVRDACDRYLNATLSFMTIPVEVKINGQPGEIPATALQKKAPSIKGNPRCKCGHGYTVHDEPKDNAAGKPENICRGCEADGRKIGCPEFVSKRGAAPSSVAPKSNGAAENGGLQAIHLAILAALKANSHRGWTSQQISILAVYVQSGTFNSAVADLRDLDLVEGSPELQLTAEGKRRAIDIGRKYDAKTLRNEWGGKLGLLSAKVIATLYEHESVASSADLAALCNYVQSGTFNSAIAKMRRMGLIARKLPLRLCPELS